jgi:SAM-dependent methyltransferase/uncharacterized protein YbaR (Trm112 family)
VRRHLLETLQPLCAHCLQQYGTAQRLIVQAEIRADATTIDQGLLRCPDPACQLEYPIIDGIPFLVPDVRRVLAEQLPAIEARDDLSPVLESVLGDAAGQGSHYDARRQHLSIYGWDAYADLVDPAPTAPEGAGSALRCLEAGCELLDSLDGPVLDLGCGAGRTTFALAARSSAVALGIDLNFSMLRLAARLQRTGSARFPLRRSGLVYDPCEVRYPDAVAAPVDFWLCDALALPLVPGAFGTVVALNLLDCVPAPLALLGAIRRMLAHGGQALLATPYDWATGATPVEGWIGGHSQRGPVRGDPAELLRRLLRPGAHPQALDGFEVLGELENQPWQTRLHDRSTMQYQDHVLALRRNVKSPG